MPAEDPKALWRRFVQECNKGKAAAIAVTDEICAPNVVWHHHTGKDTRGLKDFKQYFSEGYDVFPDTHFIIDDIFAQGDKVAVRYTITGTHKGALMGIPPTNKKVTISVIEIDRVAGGKFVECWDMYDTLGIMRQLGVAPKPSK